MKAIDRLLLTLLCLLVIVGCIFMGYLAFSEQTAGGVSNFFFNMGQSWQLKVLVIAVAFILALVALKVVFWRRPGEGYGAARQPQHVNIGAGDVSIAVSAINDIVSVRAREQDGVREAAARIETRESGIAIVLHIVTTGLTSIPIMAEGLQDGVKQVMQDICGINPSEVRVFVETQSTPVQNGIAKVK